MNMIQIKMQNTMRYHSGNTTVLSVSFRSQVDKINPGIVYPHSSSLQVLRLIRIAIINYVNKEISLLSYTAISVLEHNSTQQCTVLMNNKAFYRLFKKKNQSVYSTGMRVIP
jgi:hypothetical protein